MAELPKPALDPKKTPITETYEISGLEMIKKIRIENFMSHRDTILEPAEGVTLISGPNNCGKSAVMMALWGLSGLNEVRGDFMI